MAYQSKILSTGMYVPPKVVTNFDLEKMMDTTDEWIQKRTGIVERHWVDAATGTSDLALKACENAIQKSGIKKEDIDMIIFATLSPDHEFPGSGCFLQAKLALGTIPCFDIRQQCSGFLYGMSLADNFIKSGQCKTILLVGAEVHSKGLDKTSRGRDVSVLFGDGAGAAIITRTEVKNKNDAQIYSTHLFADGSNAKELWVAAPGSGFNSDARISQAMFDEGMHFPHMNGKNVFQHAVKRMAECLILGLKSNGFSIDDVDLFLFHQANLRINQYLAQELKIPEEKIFNTIQKYGNTTAATIPIGMADAQTAGKLKPGMLVASAAFGSGFTWASAVYRF
ncbi:MAG: 3-oxoacyl-ACP synthase III family protein [Bacteriovoracaceae bacterium]